WETASANLTLTLEGVAFFFRGNVRLSLPPTETLLTFTLRPEVAGGESLFIRLNGLERWDDSADVMGLDCKLRGDVFLTLRAFPDPKAFDLEPESILEN
ncbi:MAG: hypothetical protein ACREA9_20540, partial [Pyrinomonadaceae bacterium]